MVTHIYALDQIRTWTMEHEWHKRKHTRVALQYILHAHKAEEHSGRSQRGREVHGWWAGTNSGTH